MCGQSRNFNTILDLHPLQQLLVVCVALLPRYNQNVRLISHVYLNVFGRLGLNVAFTAMHFMLFSANEVHRFPFVSHLTQQQFVCKTKCLPCLGFCRTGTPSLTDVLRAKQQEISMFLPLIFMFLDILWITVVSLFYQVVR